jgi:hypothetical protein
MEKTGNADKKFAGIPEGNRPLGKRIRRREDNIKKDLK